MTAIYIAANTPLDLRGELTAYAGDYAGHFDLDAAVDEFADTINAGLPGGISLHGDVLSVAVDFLDRTIADVLADIDIGKILTRHDDYAATAYVESYRKETLENGELVYTDHIWIDTNNLKDPVLATDPDDGEIRGQTIEVDATDDSSVYERALVSHGWTIDGGNFHDSWNVHRTNGRGGLHG